MPIKAFHIVFFASFLGSAAMPAQNTPGNEPEELKRLRQDYNKRCEAAQKPIDAAYKLQLELLIKSLTQRNKLNAAIAVRQELLGEEMPENEPEELKRLRQEFNQKREAAQKPIDASYKQQLELLIKSLTQRNQLDAAIAVRGELDSLAAGEGGRGELREALLKWKWSWTGKNRETDVFLDFREDGTVRHRGMHGTWSIIGPRQIKLIEDRGRTLIFQFDSNLESYKCISGAELKGRRSSK
jgi:hypothetical protein